jgi:hypothetical protein
MKSDSKSTTNKREALREAACMAAAKLRGVDLVSRCRALDLPAPQSDGVLRVNVLARTIEFAPPEFEARVLATGDEAHPIDRLLVLRYLLCDVPVKASGRWITFREFPGGQFYFPAFRSRAIDPVVRVIGDDLGFLKSCLSKLDWEEMDKGDFSARVRVFGKVELALVYHRAADELPADLDVLFDSSLKRAYGAEEASALAARTCMSLSPKPCDPCIACGFCDRSILAK